MTPLLVVVILLMFRPVRQAVGLLLIAAVFLFIWGMGQ